MQPHTAAPQTEAEKTDLPAAAEYTISVEQVRDHLRLKGLSKSKDTIQRWCRAGDLDCRKMGLLNRFFTTEASLQALEEKLLPDMIADQTGTAQPHEAAAEPAFSGTQESAPDRSVQHSIMQPQLGADAAAPTGAQADAEVRAAAQSGTQIDAEVAELRAKVDGLTSQLQQAQEITKFLQDEIVSARGQRGDVVKIAEQMLGTLETIAVGGRLEKPTSATPPNPSDPVRYQQVNDRPGEV